MLSIFLAVFLTVVISDGHCSFFPATEMDEPKLRTVVNTILMDCAFQRVYDKFVLYVSGPKNYRELATVERPMDGNIPINVHQDMRGNKEWYFSRWNTLDKEELQSREFIFTAEGIDGGSRALVLAAYWKEKYEQLTGLSAAPYQIKVVTFNAGSFGDSTFQRTINRVIEKESIINFYVKRWGDYIPFSDYFSSCSDGWLFSDYMFSKEIPYATCVPVSMRALCKENYQKVVKYLLVIGYLGFMEYARSHSTSLNSSGALEIAALPIALLYSAYNYQQYLSHLIPSPSVAHKSLGYLKDS